MLRKRSAYNSWFAPAIIVLCLPWLSAGAQSQDRYKKWLDQDVGWIITARERANFLGLSSDEQREQFIVDFWEQRNPTPGSPQNSFKMEHYRRIAYANVHFASKMPGWKTDRGRIHILHGTPDSIDSHPSGAYQLANGADLPPIHLKCGFTNRSRASARM